MLPPSHAGGLEGFAQLRVGLNPASQLLGGRAVARMGKVALGYFVDATIYFIVPSIVYN